MITFVITPQMPPRFASGIFAGALLRKDSLWRENGC
jgi:hypothetical protein